MKARAFSFVQSYNALAWVSGKRWNHTYDVLIVRVQVNAAPLSLLPHFRDGLILVCLVNDLGDDLRALLDQTRIWRGEFGAMDGVGRGILHQQREKRVDAANQEG